MKLIALLVVFFLNNFLLSHYDLHNYKILNTKCSLKQITVLNIDTLKYLKEEIIGNKYVYIGEEFNKLLDSLILQPVFFFYNVGGIDNNTDPNKSNAVYFHYFNGTETFKRLKNHITAGVLKIYWQKPINVDSVVAFGRKNGRQWSRDAADFYGKQIVKDISLY
ncbi:MAG: hypothetical protein ABIR18_15235 [Chitinophagaceae bacterium]